jgi:hypothetical protein
MTFSLGLVYKFRLLKTLGLCLPNTAFRSADQLLIKVGVDMGIFKTLVETKSPVSLKELVKSTQSEEALLGRIMRGLASISAVEETGVGQYAPSKLTMAFASDKGSAGARLL